MQVRELNDRQGATPAEPPAASLLPVRAFLSGRSEDLSVDLLAYGHYARDREARGPVAATEQGEEDPVLRFRREAIADLTNHTFRFFHNQIEEIRLTAVREHLGGLPRPPGLARLVFANVVALLLVGTVALWASGHGVMLGEAFARALGTLRGLAG